MFFPTFTSGLSPSVISVLSKLALFLFDIYFFFLVSLSALFALISLLFCFRVFTLLFFFVRITYPFQLSPCHCFHIHSLFPMSTHPVSYLSIHTLSPTLIGMYSSIHLFLIPKSLLRPGPSIFIPILSLPPIPFHTLSRSVFPLSKDEFTLPTPSISSLCQVARRMEEEWVLSRKGPLTFASRSYWPSASLWTRFFNPGSHMQRQVF